MHNFLTYVCVTERGTAKTRARKDKGKKEKFCYCTRALYPLKMHCFIFYWLHVTVHFMLRGLFSTWQPTPKAKKVKEAAKAKPEEKKEEPQAEKEEAPAENGEAKAEEV